MSKDTSLGEAVAGTAPPRSFILDAAMLNYEEEHKIIREDVKRNRIVFEFPAGVNKVSVVAECRALNSLEDFDTMYDYTVQLLVGKELLIHLRDDRGGLHEVCRFVVTDRDQDWRSVEFIDQHPIVVSWLAEFISGWLLKKYPEPGKELASTQAQEPMKTPKMKRHGIFHPQPD